MSSAPKLPRPHNDRILCFVEPTSGMTTTKSGLAVVQSASEAPLVGHVLGVGPDLHIRGGIEPHNQVMFSKYASVVATIGGREYHVIEEKDVLLVWPETFELPEALRAEPVAELAPSEDGPCTCDPLEVGEPCGSSSCINIGGMSSMPEDRVRPPALILP